MHLYIRALFSSLRETVVISVVDLIPALVAVFVFRTGVLEAFGLILLVESAGLMLVGGALSFTGQEGFRRLASALTKVDLKTTKGDTDSNEMKAALYVLTGAFLFVESLVLATLTA